MAKAYINERKIKQLKQRRLIKDETQKGTRKILNVKKRLIKVDKGLVKGEEKRREEKRREEKRREEKRREEKGREEKRRYLLSRGRAILKKSTLKKLTLITMKKI